MILKFVENQQKFLKTKVVNIIEDKMVAEMHKHLQTVHCYFYNSIYKQTYTLNYIQKHIPLLTPMCFTN